MRLHSVSVVSSRAAPHHYILMFAHTTHTPTRFGASTQCSGRRSVSTKQVLSNIRSRGETFIFRLESNGPQNACTLSYTAQNCIYRRSSSACTANERDSGCDTVSEWKTINLSTSDTAAAHAERNDRRKKKMYYWIYFFSNSSFDDVRSPRNPNVHVWRRERFRFSLIANSFFVFCFSVLGRSRFAHKHRHPNGALLCTLKCLRMCALFEQKFVSIEYMFWWRCRYHHRYCCFCSANAHGIIFVASS